MPAPAALVRLPLERKIQMQGLKRKLLYATAYELIGMSISALGLALLSGSVPSRTGPLSLMISMAAMLWNMAYNHLFERWEARQRQHRRTLLRRVLHAVGFQLTLLLYLIPLIAWWMGITLEQALLLDAALIAIIPCYTFAFNWTFDVIFGAPEAARPHGRPNSG